MKKLDFHQDNNNNILNTTDFLQVQKSKYEKNNSSVLHKTLDDNILHENECLFINIKIRESFMKKRYQ